jgi:hypothetical protein
MPFTCSICGEESTRICARCTKDACDNHLCEKCLRCSDCCECEVALHEPVRPAPAPVHVPEPVVDQMAAQPEAVAEQSEPEPEAARAQPEREPQPEAEFEPDAEPKLETGD